MAQDLVPTNKSGRFDVHGISLSSSMPAAADTRIDRAAILIAEDAIGQWELREGFTAGRDGQLFDRTRTSDWRIGFRYGHDVRERRRQVAKAISERLRRIAENAA